MIDHSIYFKQKTPDIVGNLQKGLTMRQMLEQNAQSAKDRERKQAVRSAYDAGLERNEDGTASFNKSKTLSALAKVGGAEFLDAKSSFEKMDSESQFKQMDLISRVAGNITDQNSYNYGLMYLDRMGVDISKMPPTYDKNKVDFYKNMALSAKDKLEMDFKEKRLGIEKEKNLIDRQNNSLKQQEMSLEFETPFGKAITKQDAKDVKEAHEAKQSFDSKIDEMISLRKKYGPEYLNREAVERGKQLSKDLLLAYKNMAKLGVLSKADEDIINAIIPEDPLANDWAPLQDPILHRLTKFREDSDRDFQTKIQTRIRKPENSSNQNMDLNSMSDEEIDRLYQKLGGT